jgi:hypothetical protein
VGESWKLEAGSWEVGSWKLEKLEGTEAEGRLPSGSSRRILNHRNAFETPCLFDSGLVLDTTIIGRHGADIIIRSQRAPLTNKVSSQFSKAKLCLKNQPVNLGLRTSATKRS